MVNLSVRGENLVLEVQGWDRLWAFKGALEIPIAHVKDVRTDPETAREWWKGIRLPGTHVPGVVTAGTFYQHGKRIFWDVHNPDKTVVIDLADERYDELVIEVADPANAIAMVKAAISARHG